MFVVEKEPSYGSGRKNRVWVKTRMEEGERLRWRERGRLVGSGLSGPQMGKPRKD